MTPAAPQRPPAVIPAEQYREITALLPILCVDLVVRNAAGAFLLVRRANEPRRDEWWVVGGRVLRDETLPQAAARKTRQELGVEPGQLRAIGYYEEICAAGIFGPDHGTHGVSVVFETSIDDGQAIELDAQSLEWRFAPQLPADFRVRAFEDLS